MLRIIVMIILAYEHTAARDEIASIPGVSKISYTVLATEYSAELEAGDEPGIQAIIDSLQARSDVKEVRREKDQT